MAHYTIEMPCSEEAIRELKIGDTVTLTGWLHGIRDATQIHMFDRGRTTKFDLNGHAVIHTAPNVRKVEPREDCPAGYEIVCVGTTTSMRMERFTAPLMLREGVRIIIGKGGLGDDSRDAFNELGGVYLAIVGGTAALETTWIEHITDVDMDDLNPESLWKFKLKEFGPLLVAMDSHRQSMYDEVQASVEQNRVKALERMGIPV